MKQLFLFFIFSLSILGNSTPKAYITKNFSSTDGLANNIVSSIVQDEKGFLWIGTYGGLSRYDGREFKNYTMSSGLSFDAVRTVFVDRANEDLWVGTELGLTIIKKGKEIADNKEKPFLDKFIGKDIRAINKTKSGDYLIGTTEGLFKIENNEYKEVLKKIHIQLIYIASDDSVWIGTKRKGLYKLDKNLKEQKIFREKEEVISIDQEMEKPETEKRIIVSYRDSGLFSYSLKDLEGDESKFSPIDNISSSGRFLICPHKTNNKLFYLSQTESSYFPENDRYKRYPTKNVNTCFIDKEGVLWVGTYGSGLNKYYPRKIQSYIWKKTKDKNIRDANIRYIFKDSKGRLLLGTQSNIAELENGLLKKRKDAVSKVRVILEDKSGRIWFGSENGLFYLKDDDLKKIPLDVNVYSMDQFMGFLYVLDKDKKIRRINLTTLEEEGEVEILPDLSKPKPDPEVFWRIVQSLDEKILYLQSSARVLKLDPSNKKLQFTTIIHKDQYTRKIQQGEVEKEIKLNKIQAFLPITENYFIIGDDKLIIDKKGSDLIVITRDEGLPEGQIVSITKDNDENLWIGTSKGLVNYIQKTKEVIVFDKNDGLSGDFCNFNSIAADDEFAYIGTSEGLSIVKHNNEIKNKIPPKVFFTKVKINKDEPLYSFDNLHLSHDQNTIQLDAASLSLMAPDNNQYTFFHIDNGKEHEPYKQNIGSKTFYNLAHGTHTFKVKGENNDGIGSDNEDLIQIKISPPFYLDYRFMIPLTLLAFGLIYAVYTLRVYQIKQENIKLEALVQIRTKELFAEKETSERLLLNILPKNIAERLKNGESNIADSFAQVTILFADIVGFTKLSQTVNPWELVSKLNDLFSRFDKISVDLKVEKIKTIGDCYMVVAGLPEITSDHASTMIEVAKQMLSAIEDFNKTYQTTLAIRIGINTGEVVAGVIGTHKFIYDLWGDSVNTASRMESHGVPGRIHVTESTYKMVKDKYQFESRGVMEIKGKGKMETYLLTT